MTKISNARPPRPPTTPPAMAEGEQGIESARKLTPSLEERRDAPPTLVPPPLDGALVAEGLKKRREAGHQDPVEAGLGDAREGDD